MKNCPKCGNLMAKHHGTYRFKPPPNIPGGDIVIPKTWWLRCVDCGQEMLPRDLDEKIEQEGIARTSKGKP
jgi:hypothetical protein